MRQVTPHAAGVDIGAHEIVACVPDGDDQQIVRAFGTDTVDLDALADWCVDRVVFRRLPWNPLGCTGFPCLRRSKPVAATAV
jgi:hypothetical protein